MFTRKLFVCNLLAAINSVFSIEPADTSRTITIRTGSPRNYVRFVLLARNNSGYLSLPKRRRKTHDTIIVRSTAVLSPLCYTRAWGTVVCVENWLTLGDNYRSAETCALSCISFAETSHTRLWYHIPRYVVYRRFVSVAPVKLSGERKVTKNSGKHDPRDHSYFRSSKLMLLYSTRFVKQACFYKTLFENT